MEYKPHSYQLHAIEYILKHEASGLFLGLGMGKTSTTLTAINILLYQEFEVDKVLVIAPLRVAEDTWATEASKWDHLKHLKISKVLGSEADRLKALEAKADVYCVNKENTQWIVNHYGKNWPFDMIVIDELSSFKSSKSQRFKSLRKVRPFAKKVVGLTGTPAPNGLIDLWSQVYLLDSGERLGKTMTYYRDTYFNPGRRNRATGVIFDWVLKEGAEDAIYRKLSDICISMTAEDWLELPERINRVVEVTLPTPIMKQYEDLERDMIINLDTDKVLTAGSAAAITGKLQQMAQGSVYTEQESVEHFHDCKLDALEELIEEANGNPVLIFYWFKHDLSRLKARFPNGVTLNTSEDIKLWNKGKIGVLFAHPASAGHGLNLQAGGNIIIWFGITWSLELYLQANGRLDRQGQTKSVIVHHLIAKGTVDEDIMKALEGKAEGQNALIDAVKARIKKYGGTYDN